MAQKVGEEAVETVIASKNPDLADFEGEASDLLFHLMVLLQGRGSSLAKLSALLKKSAGSKLHGLVSSARFAVIGRLVAVDGFMPQPRAEPDPLDDGIGGDDRQHDDRAHDADREVRREQR